MSANRWQSHSFIGGNLFFFFPFSSFHFSLCTLYSQIQVQNSEQIVNQIFLTHFERVLKEMELAAFN